jgi:MFS family permease
LTPTTTAAPPERARLIATLLAAQICGSTGHSIGMVIGIVAAEIAGSNTWSGVPVAIGALGSALGAVPLARFMGRFGRRPGLTLGYALAVAGSGLGVLGLLTGSLPLLLLGMVFYGVGQTSNLLTRYAAADVSPVSTRGRAIGLIVWGAAAGSIVGPNLLGPATGAAGWLGLPAVGSPFLISVLFFALAGLLVQTLLRPDPLAIARWMHEAAERGLPRAAAEPLGAILRRPTVRIALGALMTSQLVMIATTSTSAVYLYDQGHPVHTIGLATSLHLGGMYITSPLSGWLADRLGRSTVIGLGAVVLIGAMVFAGLAPGSESGLITLAIFLNGVGWNFAFVAGSALLTDALAPAERTSVQGVADMVTSMMGALGSISGGLILGLWGFTVLNAVGVGLTLGPLAVAWFGREALFGRPSERAETASAS